MVREFVTTASPGRLPLYKIFVVSGAVLALLAGTLLVISPFIPALLLAIIFTFSTWPAFYRLNQRLNGRTTLAAAVMTIILALCFILPLLLLGTSLGDDFVNLAKAVIAALENDGGRPPRWLRDLPVIGQHMDRVWDMYVVPPPENGEAQARPPPPIPELLLLTGTKIARGLVDLALGIMISFFFFRHGVSAARRLGVLLERFLGPYGQHLLDVSKKTVIGVVYGMLGTALVQGLLAGAGFWIAGVPGAAILGLLTVFLSLFPVGPPMVWVPATIWLFTQHKVGMGIFMGLWGLCVVSLADNVIRPWFISRGSNLPLLVVLIGLFGGIIAFGFIGVFIGPVVLAVAYTLILEWSFMPPRRVFNMAVRQNGPVNPIKLGRRLAF